MDRKVSQVTQCFEPMERTADSCKRFPHTTGAGLVVSLRLLAFFVLNIGPEIHREGKARSFRTY